MAEAHISNEAERQKKKILPDRHTDYYLPTNPVGAGL